MKPKRFPELYDVNGNMVAVLHNAYNISYKKIKNGLWTCSFKLPLDDSKSALVMPKHHIALYDHDQYVGRFIVNPKRTSKNETAREISFECEHVLALLHNDILFRYHQLSNYTTTDVLEYLLDIQEVAHWQLGTVDFTRYFHYSWENEDSLLNAIMSVPKPFDVSYMWTWDDTTYPYTLNLVEPSDELKDVIVAGKNLKGIEIVEDPSTLVTRIYGLGAGEGVNQVDITKVNAGLPYLRNAASEAQYGVHKYIFADNRFEDANSLKATMQALLDKYKEPIKTCSVDAIDYYLKEYYDLGRYTVGDLLGVFDLDTSTNTEMRVEVYGKSDIYGAPDDLTLELGNKIGDIGMTISDLQKKQLVNEVYSQGATNIDSRDFVGECDENYPAIIRFHIPDDVVNINSMLLTFETLKYRAYSKAIKGGGAEVISSTSDAGGAVASRSQSSAGGGAVASTSKTSAGGGNHRHLMFDWIDQPGGSPSLPLNGYLAASNLGGDAAYRIVEMYSEAGDLYTAGASGDHSHTFEIPAIEEHTHEFTIPAIDAHSHEFEVNIPEHTHAMEHGIFEYANLPSTVSITVDGNAVPGTALSGENIDLIPYLMKDTDGKIARGRFAEIVLTPNDLARINATVTSRLFIQSRIGGKY